MEDGVLGLFRGSVAGIMRNVPHSALVYTIYPQMEAVVLSWQHGPQPATASSSAPQKQQQQQQQAAGGAGGGKVAFSTRFVAGYVTTFSATLVTHPLDTLRVRLSVTHGEAASTPAMIRAVMETGGVRALYQGFGATLIGAGPRGALGFGVFETLKDGARHAART